MITSEMKNCVYKLLLLINNYVLRIGMKLGVYSEQRRESHITIIVTLPY